MSSTLHRAMDRDAKRRMATTGENLTTARKAVRIIRELMVELDADYDTAQAYYDDPANELLCATCGWTKGMICPECVPGCGCVTNCSNSRHDGWRESWDEYERGNDCTCGADHEYHCVCGKW